MEQYRYTVYFEKVDGGYNVVVPALPEICTCASTLDEARAMAKDAIRCAIEGAQKAGESIPDDIERTARKELISVAL